MPCNCTPTSSRPNWNKWVVELQRGLEAVSFSPSTVVQIEDKPGKQYTTVKAGKGEVSVVADVRNVMHFEVRSPYIAAVKGTSSIVVT